jgi:hypothetical protein
VCDQGETTANGATERWWENVAVSRLNLAENELSELPDAIANLGSLTSLDVW